MKTLEALRLRFFPRWVHPFAAESVFYRQQERAAKAEVRNWFALHLAEL